MSLHIRKNTKTLFSTDKIKIEHDNSIVLTNRQNENENQNYSNQILSVNDKSCDYISTNIQETDLNITSSQINLIDDKKINNKSKNNLVVITVLFIINLINYIDRFSLAGELFLYYLFLYWFLIFYD